LDFRFVCLQHHLLEPVLGRIVEVARSATDCFVFCRGWIRDEAEARRAALPFFTLLDGALLPLRDQSASRRAPLAVRATV
jgi:hypothetical protein